MTVITDEQVDELERLFISTHPTGKQAVLGVLARLRSAEEEAAYYLKELNEIWAIAAPNKRGQTSRYAVTRILGKAADACTYRERFRMEAHFTALGGK